VAFFVSNEVVRKTNGDDDCATTKSKNRWKVGAARPRLMLAVIGCLLCGSKGMMLSYPKTHEPPRWQIAERIQIVIPAKAGIHPQYEAWIPAFAGMTMGLSERSRVMQVVLGFARHPSPQMAAPAKVGMTEALAPRITSATCRIPASPFVT